MNDDLNPWCNDDQYEHDQLIENLLKNKIKNFINNELKHCNKIVDSTLLSDERYYQLGKINAYENLLNYITY